MRFFYRGLLFWNPVFETKIDLYKFIRIFLFIIRGTVFIFLITLEIITYEEIGKKNQFEAGEQQMMTEGILIVSIVIYLIIEIFILTTLYLYSSKHKPRR
jgi:uncharacterized membrane protein YjgN (DUF898 family)